MRSTFYKRTRLGTFQCIQVLGCSIVSDYEPCDILCFMFALSSFIFCQYLFILAFTFSSVLLCRIYCSLPVPFITNHPIVMTYLNLSLFLYIFFSHPPFILVNSPFWKPLKALFVSLLLSVLSTCLYNYVLYLICSTHLLSSRYNPC